MDVRINVSIMSELSIVSPVLNHNETGETNFETIKILPRHEEKLIQCIFLIHIIQIENIIGVIVDKRGLSLK